MYMKGMIVLMGIINNISVMAVPLTIFFIVVFAVKEKTKIFDNFIDGAKEGLEIVVSLFPTLLGLFVAIGVLRSSGILDLFINILSPLINLFNIPVEIMPLALLRPISGSAAMAIAIDMMNQYGVDSLLGKIISTIMGSTETTLYTIAIYTAAVGVKKIRFVLVAALLGDLIGMVTSVVICRILS